MIKRIPLRRKKRYFLPAGSEEEEEEDEEVGDPISGAKGEHNVGCQMGPNYRIRGARESDGGDLFSPPPHRS